MRRIALPADGSIPPAEAQGRILVTRARPLAKAVERASSTLRIVLAGEEHYEIDGRRIRLGEGCMMLLPAGAPITIEGRGAAGVSLELPAGATEEDSLSGAVLLPLVSHPVGEWLEEAAKKLHEDGSDATAVAAGAFRDLPIRVAQLVTDCRFKIAGLDAAKEITRLDLVGRIELARAHLRANLSRAVPLWELAEAARLSPFHMSRAFRDICNSTPSAYHRELRMEEAASRLGSGVPPAQVARDLGFSSHASFTRAFRRQHGVPPAQYLSEQAPAAPRVAKERK